MLIFSLPVYGEKNYDIDECINDILLIKKVNNNSISNGYLINSEMMSNIFSKEDSEFVIALSQYGITDNINLYGKVLLGYLEDKYSQTQKLSDLNTSSGAQIALTLLSCGYNPLYITAKSGKVYNFLADTIYKRDSAFSLGKDGIEAYALGLIAIDAYDYKLTDDIWEIRNELITQIVNNQEDDGTFAASGTASSYYLTALVLTAVHKYYQNDERKEAEIQERIAKREETDKKRLEEGKKATFEEFEKQYEAEQEPTLYDKLDITIEKCIEALSNAQDENGSYECEKENNVRVTSAVITALCSMGINPLEEKLFIKNDNNLIDGLMKLKKEDGSFLSNENADVNADTIHAFSALVSYYRLINGKTPLYDFSKKKFTTKTTMLSVSEADINNLKNLGKNLCLDDYPYLYTLRSKLATQNTPKANYWVSYIDYLLNRLLQQQRTIDYINSRGNEIVYSAKGLNLFMQRELNSLLVLCDTLPQKSKDKILIYDDLKEISKKLDTSITIDTIIFAVGTVIVLSFILVFLLMYIKKKALKSLSKGSENVFPMHFSKNTKQQEDGDLKLPFEDNEIFFDYDEELSESEEDEKNKMLPFENEEDFFEYGDFTPTESDDFDEFNLPFENDDSFFEYYYNEIDEKNQ